MNAPYTGPTATIPFSQYTEMQAVNKELLEALKVCFHAISIHPEGSNLLKEEADFIKATVAKAEAA